MGADVDIRAIAGEFGGASAALQIFAYFGAVARRGNRGKMPAAVDDLPMLLVAASLLRRRYDIDRRGRLRHKESDRLSAVYDGLTALGIACELREDGMLVRGGGRFGGGELDARGDHRIAMAFSIAALRASGEIIGAYCGQCQNII